MTYEYRCKECGAGFEVTASVAEKEAGLRPNCPSCGSTEAVQVFGAIGILSAGSRGVPATMGPGCGPGRGPGCC